MPVHITQSVRGTPGGNNALTHKLNPQACLIRTLLEGDEYNPFAVLGPHSGPQGVIVRVFRPDACAVNVVASDGSQRVSLPKLHPSGFFAGPVPWLAEDAPYTLALDTGAGTREIADPYRFGPVLGEADLYLHAEGNWLQSYDKMGAHLISMDGVAGVSFAVWAPNARRVSVVGDFNGWDGRVHCMRLHPSGGLWDIFIPGLEVGQRYKFEIKTRDGRILLKADPFAFTAECPPKTASVITAGPKPVTEISAVNNGRDAPIAIYEAHLGSWKKGPDGKPLSYRTLAEEMVPYVRDMGYTHIELMPVSEHPFDASWGYQPTGLFAPTARMGSPEDFQYFVAACHKAGLGLILDWSAGHFPNDAHGLEQFDGTHLYEHEDPREGWHPDWHSLIYNLGRNEVRGYLLANAMFWMQRYAVDGLRVDAVASMLYRNYSRKEGEWIPNIYGGVENLESIAFLRQMNERVYGRFPGAMTVAEESTAWPMVSRPTYIGGLGFGYKWNMGWMHDTLVYMSKDPVYRRYHHDNLTFGLIYAFTENFILPLSHDEVVHGKGSLISKMPGDGWQKFANLRAYYAFQYTMPGKKLLFMGGEFAQGAEWCHDRPLDWYLLERPQHKGVQDLVRDLNHLYRDTPALYQGDCEADGFSWIDCHDADNCVISFLRYAADKKDFCVVVCNFTPVVREGYQIGVPHAGSYHEIFNSDAEKYGGSNVGNGAGLMAEETPSHGLPASLKLTLPPLSVVIFKPE